MRQAFPDGVIWLAFGQSPNVVRLQRNVVTALGGNGDFENEAQGKAELRELSLTKAVLLVCDDVWEARHIAPFDLLGPRCRLIVTTRDAGLLRALGAAEHLVELLSEADSLVLLAKTSGQYPAHLPAAAREVTRECGYLPLALALCGGMAYGDEGVGWDTILEALRSAALEEIVTDHPPEWTHASLWRAIGVSVQRFKPDEQRRFAELAVFSEDEAVPEAAVRTLWSHTGGMSPIGMDRLLKRFAEHSLIYLDADRTDRDKPKRRVRLHDLLHDYARRLAGDTTALHESVLESYRILCPGGWAEGPDDGYFFTHLCWHLLRAEQTTSLRSLLVGERKWMDIKFQRMGSDASFLTDVNLGLSQYKDLLASQQLQEVTQLYAVRSVVHERVSRYTCQMTEALIWLGREDQALSLTRLRLRNISGRALVENRLGYRGAPSLEGQGLLGLVSIFATVYRRDGSRTEWLAYLEDDIVQRIEQLDNHEDRLEAVRAFVPVLIGAGQHALAERLCELCCNPENVEGAGPLPDWKLEDLIGLVVRLFARTQNFDRARHWIGKLTDRDREMSYVSLSEAYAGAGELDQAEEALRMVQSPWLGQRANLALALAYARTGRFERATALLDAMNTNLGLIEALCDLARIYFKNHMRSVVQSSTAQIESRIHEVRGDYDWSSTEEQQAYAYMALGRLYADLGDAAAAKRALQMAKEQAFRGRTSHEVEQATVQLLVTMVIAGFHGEAIELARSIPRPVGEWLQSHVAAALADKDDVGRAEQVAGAIADPHYRMNAFLSLSITHSMRSRPGAASRCFDEAVAAAAGAREGGTFIQTLCAVSRALYEAGRPEASEVLLFAADSLLQSVRAGAEEGSPVAGETSWAFERLGPIQNRAESEPVLMELLRQGHFDQVAKVLRAGVGSVGSMSFAKLRPIRQPLLEASLQQGLGPIPQPDSRHIAQGFRPQAGHGASC